MDNGNDNSYSIFITKLIAFRNTSNATMIDFLGASLTIDNILEERFIFDIGTKNREDYVTLILVEIESEPQKH